MTDIKKPQVSTTHPSYSKMKDKWSLVRKVINSEVEDLVWQVDPTDKQRNFAYTQRAQFTNFTNRTRSGLVGQVFRKLPVVNIPSELEYINNDADGRGTPLIQMLQKSVGEALEVGRQVILTDMEPNEEDLDAETSDELALGPRLKTYSAESFVNWNETKYGSKIRQNLAVFKEDLEELDKDGFSWNQRIQYRVLRLVDGVYVQHLYAEDGTYLGSLQPLDNNQQPFDHLTCHIVGSTNNDLDLDNPPLYDMARLNVGHLNNSADLEENAFVHGQMTLFVNPGDMDRDEFEARNPAGIKVGARAAHILGQGSTVNKIQADPNQLADKLMQRKEEQAVMIGARLITPSAGIETAEAARIRNASENSSLSTIVKNVSMAYTNALKDCARFLGLEQSKIDSISVELNEEFYEEGIDPNELIASIALLEKGVIAMKDLRDRLRDKELIDPERDDAAIDAEANPVENEPAQEITEEPLNTDNRL